MIRVALSVEGQTENEFCRKVLTPFFRNHKIEMTPIIATTSKDRCGRKHKGGCITIERVNNEVKKLLASHDYVSTFYDFYGFNKRPTDDVDELEQILYDLINNKKFIPYIQKYEFETLLFSKPEYYTEYFHNTTVSDEMEKIVEYYSDIESINGSFETSPHKRIENLFLLQKEKYDKVFHGEGIVHDIGLDAIRNKAVRFNNWVQKIESLNDL